MKERRDIVEAGRRLYAKGLIASLDGNISCRVGGDRMLITPSGLCKGDIKPSDITLTDLDGNVIAGRLKPSSEMKMHLIVYKKRPDVTAVVHAHPPVATAFTVSGQSLDRKTLTEMVMFLGSIMTAEYATPGTEGIPRSIEKIIGDTDGILLANHGALTVGGSVMEAFHRMAALEHFAIVTLNARLLGGERELPAEEVEKLLIWHRGGK